MMTPADTQEQLRVNVRELMRSRRITQSVLASRLGQSQPWVSKRLSGKTGFAVEDLDDLAVVFGITPADLLRPGIGVHDRRTVARRRRPDRREGAITRPARPFQGLSEIYDQTTTSPDSLLTLAHTLTALAEELQAGAAALLGRYAATAGGLSPDRPESDSTVRGGGSSPYPRKATG